MLNVTTAKLVAATLTRSYADTGKTFTSDSIGHVSTAGKTRAVKFEGKFIEFTRTEKEQPKNRIEVVSIGDERERQQTFTSHTQPLSSIVAQVVR